VQYRPKSAACGDLARPWFVVESVFIGHAGNIRRYFLDALTPEQAQPL
jgi:hypothetical protein